MQYVCQNSNANSSKHTTSYQKAIKNEYPIHPHGIQSKYQVNTHQALLPRPALHSLSYPHTLSITPPNSYTPLSYPPTPSIATPPRSTLILILSIYDKHGYRTKRKPTYEKYHTALQLYFQLYYLFSIPNMPPFVQRLVPPTVLCN